MLFQSSHDTWCLTCSSVEDSQRSFVSLSSADKFDRCVTIQRKKMTPASVLFHQKNCSDSPVSFSPKTDKSWRKIDSWMSFLCTHDWGLLQSWQFSQTMKWRAASEEWMLSMTKKCIDASVETGCFNFDDNGHWFSLLWDVMAQWDTSFWSQTKTWPLCLLLCIMMFSRACHWSQRTSILLCQSCDTNALVDQSWVTTSGKLFKLSACPKQFGEMEVKFFTFLHECHLIIVLT